MEDSAYEVIQIDEGSWRIEENGVRSFLFTGADKALLVDSGYGTGNLRAVAESLTALPIMLVNTHADGDHVGANALFEKAYMHPSEYDRFHQAMGHGPAVAPLWEGDIIDLGGRRFQVILIPGHTPGSIALLDDARRILLAGDSVQAGIVYLFGPGRDIDAYLCSLRELARMRDCFSVVYPSHGPFPVDAGLIDGFITAVEKIRGGKLEGSPPPYDVPALLYESDGAKLLYKP